MSDDESDDWWDEMDGNDSYYDMGSGSSYDDFEVDDSSEDEDEDMDSAPKETREEAYRHQHSMKIMDDLNKDRQAGEMCDLVIKVDGQEFPVHRIILKMTSPYFRAMFSGSFSEQKKNCIQILGVSKDAFKFTLNFLYGEAGQLTKENLLEVYNCADMLSIDNLLKDCKDFLRDQWQLMKDKAAAYLLAKRMEIIEITEAITTKYCSDFTTIIKESHFLEMPFEMLMEILAKKVKTSHLNVVEAITLWVTHDPHSRIPKVNNLVSLVPLDQLPNITMKKLIKALKKLSFVDKAIAKDRDALVAKIQSVSMVIRRRLHNLKLNLVCISKKPRVSDVAIREFHYSTLDWTNHDPSIKILKKGDSFLMLHEEDKSDCTTKAIETFPPFDSGIKMVDECDNVKAHSRLKTEEIEAFAILEDNLYIFGSQTVLVYNLMTQSTTALQCLPIARKNFCVVVTKNTMIVIGGNKQKVLQYNFHVNSWQEMCSWKNSRYKVIDAVHCNDVIYMICEPKGKNLKTGYIDHLFSYHMSLRCFTKLTNLERPKNCSLRIVVFDDKLYVFGVYSSLDSRDFVSSFFPLQETCLCQIYNKGKKMWSDSKATITRRDQVLDVTAVAEGIVVVVMSTEEYDTKITVSLYTPERDALDFVACLPVPPEHRFLLKRYFHVEAR